MQPSTSTGIFLSYTLYNLYKRILQLETVQNKGSIMKTINAKNSLKFIVFINIKLKLSNYK